MAIFFLEPALFFSWSPFQEPISGFDPLETQIIMASSSSESSEVWSPTGSVLITRTSRDPAAPFQFFPDLAQTFDEAAFENGTPKDMEGTSMPSAAENKREVTDDWLRWETMDSTAMKMTSDRSDSLDLQRLEPQRGCRPSLCKDSWSCEDNAPEIEATPFHKWMKTLHRRARRRQSHDEFDSITSPPAHTAGVRHTPSYAKHHRQSSSGSSFGFVEAVRTASISLASGSVFTRSRRNSASSSRTQTHTDCSSRASMSSNRCSEESSGLDRPQIISRASVERSLQRRRILEELISTEEGYIGDVRFLMNVSHFNENLTYHVTSG